MNADGSQSIKGSTFTLSTPSQKQILNTSLENGIDLNKRPRHIYRKKKYWAKVVCKGKPKMTLKPATPKHAFAEKNTSEKSEKPIPL